MLQRRRRVRHTAPATGGGVGAAVAGVVAVAHVTASQSESVQASRTLSVPWRSLRVEGPAAVEPSPTTTSSFSAPLLPLRLRLLTRMRPELLLDLTRAPPTRRRPRLLPTRLTVQMKKWPGRSHSLCGRVTRRVLMGVPMATTSLGLLTTVTLAVFLPRSLLSGALIGNRPIALQGDRPIRIRLSERLSPIVTASLGLLTTLLVALSSVPHQSLLWLRLLSGALSWKAAMKTMRSGRTLTAPSMARCRSCAWKYHSTPTLMRPPQPGRSRPVPRVLLVFYRINLRHRWRRAFLESGLPTRDQQLHTLLQRRRRRALSRARKQERPVQLGRLRAARIPRLLRLLSSRV